MKKPVPAAIVGLGRIASLLEEDSLREKPCTHAGAIADNPGCELVAGCDIDGERRRLFAQRWQVPVYEDAAEMLRVHAPQILAIATHPDSHYRYCRLAAACGVRVVICEKPLADTISDARKITRLEKDGLVIITNHERRYSKDYVHARAILKEEKLGRLLSVRAVLYMGKARRLLDVFWHDGTHLADAIMFLADARLKHRKRRGTQLSATTGTTWLEGELVQTSGLQWEKSAPVPVVMEIGAGRDHLTFETEFSCERGRLRIGNGIFEVWESAPSPYAEKFRSLRRTDEVFSGPTGYFANMVQDAVTCTLEGDHLPHSSAADGLRVIEYLNSVKAWH